MNTDKEKLAIFIDHANVSRALSNLGLHLDGKDISLYPKLRDYISEGRFLVEAFIYYPIPPSDAPDARRYIESLQEMGFFVREKLGKPAGPGKYKCNVDVEMAIDILRFTHHGSVDVVCIAAGDGDMVPVIEEVRFSGIRCEVASTGANIARELRLAASGFISLEMALSELGVEVKPRAKRKQA